MQVFLDRVSDLGSETYMLWEAMVKPEEIQVDASAPPTSKEFGFFAWTFADSIRDGIPILEGVKLAYGSTTNPWLRRMASQMFADVNEGGLFSPCLKTAPFVGVIDSRFETALKVGEQDGELDFQLLEYAAQALEGVDESLSSALQRSPDLDTFTTAFYAAMQEGETWLGGIAGAAKALQGRPAADLATRIGEAVTSGSSLSEACGKLSGAELFFDPFWRAMVDFGERGGTVDIAMELLAAQSKPIQRPTRK